MDYVQIERQQRRAVEHSGNSAYYDEIYLIFKKLAYDFAKVRFRFCWHAAPG
jgi:hypothetical protein